MARISRNFWLAGLSLMLQSLASIIPAATAHETSLRFSIDRAFTGLHDAHAAFNNRQVWNNLLNHPCRYSSHFQVRPTESIESSNELPDEGKNHRTIVEQALNSVQSTKTAHDAPAGTEQINWSTIAGRLNSVTRSIGDGIADFHEQIGAQSIRFNPLHLRGAWIHSVMHTVSQTTIEPISHSFSWIFSGQTAIQVNRLASETSDSLATEMANADTHPFQLEADAQDSYWQYYEDCDRWGVRFADQFLEVHSSTVSSFAKLPAALSVKPLVAGYNHQLWNWLAGTNGTGVVFQFREFLADAEFRAVESATTEFRLIGSTGMCSPAMEVQSHIRRLYRQMTQKQPPMNEMADRYMARISISFTQWVKSGNDQLLGWQRWVKNIRNIHPTVIY